VLLYGEEIGLGDNPEIEGRGAVRVPMQWTADPDGGFTSPGAADDAHRSVRGEFGPERVNVQAQRHDSDSMLNWMERQIRLRKELPELGFGATEVLDAGDDAVLAIRSEWRGRVAVVVHNFGGEERTVTLDLGGAGDGDGDGATLADLSTDQAYDDPGKGKDLRVGGYGYRWLRLST